MFKWLLDMNMGSTSPLFCNATMRDYEDFTRAFNTQIYFMMEAPIIQKTVY